MTNKSKAIIEVSPNCLRELNVMVLSSTRVGKLIHKERKIYGIRAKSERFHTPAIILTADRRTYPSTDSTGDGYKVVKRVGHTVTPLYATESPLVSDKPYIQEKTLQRLSLQDITLRVLNKEGCVSTERTVDLFFTHLGISDPAALCCPSFINKELEKMREPVAPSLDCFPAQTK